MSFLFENITEYLKLDSDLFLSDPCYYEVTANKLSQRYNVISRDHDTIEHLWQMRIEELKADINRDISELVHSVITRELQNDLQNVDGDGDTPLFDVHVQLFLNELTGLPSNNFLSHTQFTNSRISLKDTSNDFLACVILRNVEELRDAFLQACIKRAILVGDAVDTESDSDENINFDQSNKQGLISKMVTTSGKQLIYQQIPFSLGILFRRDQNIKFEQLSTKLQWNQIKKKSAFFSELEVGKGLFFLDNSVMDWERADDIRSTFSKSCHPCHCPRMRIIKDALKKIIVGGDESVSNEPGDHLPLVKDAMYARLLQDSSDLWHDKSLRTLLSGNEPKEKKKNVITVSVTSSVVRSINEGHRVKKEGGLMSIYLLTRQGELVQGYSRNDRTIDIKESTSIATKKITPTTITGQHPLNWISLQTEVVNRTGDVDLVSALF